MTDNPAPYRSNMAVSQRVDRAWVQGYETGKHAWKRRALVVIAVGIYLSLRRRRLPGAVWFLVADAVLVALCVAAVVLPILGIIWILRCAIRHHANRPVPAPVVRLEDGSTF